jgi:hypothetical protein
MQLNRSVVALTLSLMLAAGTAALAESHTEKGKEPAGQMDPAMAEMMQKWEAHATPGDAHKALEPFAGKWTTVSKWWMSPGGEPMESKGEAESTWILGGRFLQQAYKGDMMGEPFTGIGVTGYDNTAKTYVSTWMDSMSTSVMLSKGTYDAAKKEFTFTGSYSDPMSGKDKSTRMVLKVASDDQHTFEMYESGPDGKEYKAGEMTYSRVK